MIQLTREEFCKKKKSDFLTIFGCGSSINRVDFDRIKRFDSIGMNWFCYARHSPTWYLVREQCITAGRVTRERTQESFIKQIGKLDTTLVVKDLWRHKESYKWGQNTDRLPGSGYVFREIYGKCGAKSFRDNIFDAGIHHGSGSIYDVLHFAVGMGYTNLLFCGVDLNDSRYFWSKNTIEEVTREGRDQTSTHPMAGKTIKIIQQVIDCWGLQTWTYNPQSLLTSIMEVWDG
jgi:hypothetical protein